MPSNKKLVLVSTIIHGVRRSSFLWVPAEYRIEGKVKIPENKLPGVDVDLMRGVTMTVG